VTENSRTLRLETRDRLAILTIDQPDSKVNTLGRPVLQEFERLLSELQGRRDLEGLIIKSGKPGHFIAGADLNELGSPTFAPDQVKHLVELGLRVPALLESLPFPTVAAIEGPCVGGGLEFMLGCDYRILSTHPKTELGAPEVKIGLIPGWGGTQRLSRVIGPSFAAEMICSGDSIKAQRARDIGLATDIVPGDRLVEEAARLLGWAWQTGNWREERLKKRQPIGLNDEQHAFTFAAAQGQLQARNKANLPAPKLALEAIEKGCNLPLEDGLRIESERFIPLVGSPISRNLIGVFFLTQRLQKDTGVSDRAVQPRLIERVGVLGAGLMGSGIAGAMIRRGITTAMLDSVPQAIDKGVQGITKTMQASVESGRMKSDDMVQSLARLCTTMQLAAMGDRDLVIEAIIENEGAKSEVYRQLAPLLKPDAILASNTSTISISRMAKSAPDPGRFAGMHFFNPVDRMPLVEVIRGDKTSDETVVTLVALAKRIGKTPIVVKDCPGFLVNRVLFPYLNESLVLLEEGAEPRALDRGALAFGMPMGPVTLNDVVGLDTSLFAGRVINEAFADRGKSSPILDELVKRGRLGQKSGAGFYSYQKGPKGADDPALGQILAAFRKGQRQLSEEEITDRLFLPMLTEASRVLEEGIVREPGDVDMGLILGIGFPPHKGGILRWADNVGLPQIIKKLERYTSLGKRFEPTEQMRQFAQQGKGFYKA
jgi:3-hydroxyacyl-CoA dehydrogenase/enoyl-CoA hydratase/3-hydroxybutyryl-CoA epimerase/3-hydroxyacyl-CoA dehydrogenase/enoyl-CoA hydratase/3-hydroxybutyryl-CoA epimerase/enoyl-CoA isomerase